jgi:hypothetical protein
MYLLLNKVVMKIHTSGGVFNQAVLEMAGERGRKKNDMI